MRQMVVTGGDGFIGRQVRAEARVRGWHCPSFDRQTGKDIRHFDDVLWALDGADAVIHLAGVLGTHELFDDPQLAVDVNVTGTLNVLEACRRTGAAFVGITMPQVFPSIYTATKVAATRLASAYRHSCGVPVSHVRAFNAFGVGQAHGAGHPQKIVPTFAVEAWAGRPIPIWGDGEQTVDLIDISQLARLLVEAVDHGDDVTFDGGTGRAFTVNQVAQMVLDITGSKAGMVHLPMRRGETPTQIVATGEGWDRLDWQPRFDEDEFLLAVEWYRNWP
jgi:UDP-glucose 4-epimerase